MNAPDHIAIARREQRFRLLLLGLCGAVIVTWMIVGLFHAPKRPDRFTNSYSGSPGGHLALVELLRDNGRQVRRDAARLQLPEFDSSSGDTLLLLEPGPDFVEAFASEVSSLFEDARKRHSSLIVALPKRHYESVRLDEDGSVVLTEYLHPLADVNSVLAATGFDRWFRVHREDREQTAVTGRIPHTWRDVDSQLHDVAQVLRPLTPGMSLPANMEVFVGTQQGDIIAVRFGVNEYESLGGLILISDPDMFANRYIAEPGMANLAMLMFERTPTRGTIIIDEALHGFAVDSSLGYLASRPPGLWVSLSVLLLLLVFAWRQATVMRPRSALPQDRDARLYAIEGLARLMERAARHRDAALRILRRSALAKDSVLSSEAGKAGASLVQPRITSMGAAGVSEVDQLMIVARRVAAHKRAEDSS
jgi:hypothetical protein